MIPPPSRRLASGRWYGPGDVNAFFGLAVDNLTNLVVLAGLLVGVFGFPSDLVLYRIVPGTALGVLGPVMLATHDPVLAWKVGMGVTIAMGVS